MPKILAAAYVEEVVTSHHIVKTCPKVRLNLAKLKNEVIATCKHWHNLGMLSQRSVLAWHSSLLSMRHVNMLKLPFKYICDQPYICLDDLSDKARHSWNTERKSLVLGLQRKCNIAFTAGRRPDKNYLSNQAWPYLQTWVERIALKCSRNCKMPKRKALKIILIIQFYYWALVLSKIGHSFYLSSPSVNSFPKSRLVPSIATKFDILVSLAS